MRKLHAPIIDNRPSRRKFDPPLVQSTDQSFHRWFHLIGVAVIVAASFG